MSNRSQVGLFRTIFPKIMTLRCRMSRKGEIMTMIPNVRLCHSSQVFSHESQSMDCKLDLSTNKPLHSPDPHIVSFVNYLSLVWYTPKHRVYMVIITLKYRSKPQDIPRYVPKRGFYTPLHHRKYRLVIFENLYNTADAMMLFTLCSQKFLYSYFY